MLTSPMTARTFLLLLTCLALSSSAAEDPQPITFNKNFEGGSLGTVEVLEGGATFRCHVEGQHDQRGHNRQASWYFFRLGHAAGRDVTLTLTDFVGEYNDKPGAVPMAADIRPVFSDDGTTWTHFSADAATWDAEKKELTLHFKPAGDSIWIAHVPPYTPKDLERLLGDVGRSKFARVEAIGKTAGGRDLRMVTVTDESVADAGKKVVWLQARQHAWEAGTSWVMEGATRFVISDDPRAADLRKRVVFRFTPMLDVDGCATGKVRFNANGYDVNRHWAEVDLRSKTFLERMPEIWYAKKAITTSGRIDLMVNLHNTETAEYLDTRADDDAVVKRMRRFEELLVERTGFDPSRRIAPRPSKVDDTNSLWVTHKVPVMLMEQRIAVGRKLGRQPTTEDRLKFGRDLIGTMADAVLE
jgi:hypothetical protein